MAIKNYNNNRNKQPNNPAYPHLPDIALILDNVAPSRAEIEPLLKEVNTTQSSGHDGIPTRLLKEASPSLAVLYNLSFQTGDIRQDRKDATVSPIHKNGAKTSQKNYRPMSLHSITSQTLEKECTPSSTNTFFSTFRPNHLVSANMTAQSCSWPDRFSRFQLFSNPECLYPRASLT